MRQFKFFYLPLNNLKHTHTYTYITIYKWGHEVAQLVEALRYKQERSIPDDVIEIFH